MDETNWFRSIFPKHTTQSQTTEKTKRHEHQKQTLRTQVRHQEPAAIKTVSLQVAVTRPDLQNAVRKAFELAKSGGRELDLAFTLQPFMQSFPRPSDIRAAHLASPRVGC
jgi:hypothetical protein